MRKLKNAGIGAVVTILYGDWKGHNYPADYTIEEAIKLLELVTLHTHGLQIFGGIHSRGLQCRGGNDFIIYNMQDDRKVIPCCHGSSFPTSLEEIFFKTLNRTRIKCSLDTCLSDYMFICNINGVMDEIEPFENICNGDFDFIGLDSVLNFIHDLLGKGYRVSNYKKFREVERYNRRYSKYFIKKYDHKKKYGENIYLDASNKKVTIQSAPDQMRGQFNWIFILATKNSLKPKIKKFIRNIPVLGYLIWRLYRTIKKPSRDL